MTSSCRFESPIRHNRSTGPAAQLHMHVDTGTIKIFVAWLAQTWGGSHMNWLSLTRRPFRMYTGPTAHNCVHAPALGQPLGERGLNELKIS